MCWCLQELYSQPTELFSYAPPDTKKLTWKWTVVQGQLFDQKQFTIPGSEKNSLVECMKDCEAQAACDSVSLKPGLFGQDKCSLMTVGTSTPNVAPLPSSPLFQLKRNQNDIPSSNNCQLAGNPSFFCQITLVAFSILFVCCCYILWALCLLFVGRFNCSARMSEERWGRNSTCW